MRKKRQREKDKPRETYEKRNQINTVTVFLTNITCTVIGKNRNFRKKIVLPLQFSRYKWFHDL
jgi:hypothetical protein